MGADYVKNTMVLPNVNLKPAVETTASIGSCSVPFFATADGQDHAYLGSNHNVIVDEKGSWISMLHTGHGGAPGIFIDGVRVRALPSQERTPDELIIGIPWRSLPERFTDKYQPGAKDQVEEMAHGEKYIILNETVGELQYTTKYYTPEQMEELGVRHPTFVERSFFHTNSYLKTIQRQLTFLQIAFVGFMLLVVSLCALVTFI